MAHSLILKKWIRRKYRIIFILNLILKGYQPLIIILSNIIMSRSSSITCSGSSYKSISYAPVVSSSSLSWSSVALNINGVRLFGYCCAKFYVLLSYRILVPWSSSSLSLNERRSRSKSSSWSWAYSWVSDSIERFSRRALKTSFYLRFVNTLSCDIRLPVYWYIYQIFK